jgi:hypothetical protein
MTVSCSFDCSGGDGRLFDFRNKMGQLKFHRYFVCIFFRPAEIAR